MNQTEKLIVEAEAAGKRLDQFLSIFVGSRARAEQLINQSNVLVDGVKRPKSYKVKQGDQIEFQFKLIKLEYEHSSLPIELKIIYEDDDLIVIDKPAGIVVHPGRGNYQRTLIQQLHGRASGGPDPQRPGVVHRLDKNTSGLLLVAKNETAHRLLVQMLSKREIKREYLALVAGVPAKSGVIEAAIGRDKRQPTRISLNSTAGKFARTFFTIEKNYPGFSLLRLTLDTGRTHQIRVHLNAIGHPVVGDPEYGQAPALGLNRQFLHAAKLGFIHPLTAENLSFTSQLPPELNNVLTRLE